MSATPDPKKARILVVEDEAIVAHDIAVLLHTLGYETVGHAARGEEAIGLAVQTRPDLVLMDIELAGALDGIAAAQAIRSLPQSTAAIVFLTAFDADETLERAKLAEPFGYLLKPFSERELRVVLEMALYKNQSETRLREASQYREAILENMLDGVITFRNPGVVESCNRAANRIFRFEANEALGRSVFSLVPAHQRHQLESFLQHLGGPDATPPATQTRELVGLRKDGSEFPLSLSLSEVMLAGQHARMAIARDMSPQHEAAEEIYYLAFYDRLTGLPNRRLLFDYLKQALLNSVRSGQHGALILLDLDHFKRLNDTLGHAVGDELLQQVAKRLKTAVRESDQVARIGGDEFVVLLSGLSTQADIAASQAEATATKLLQGLGKPYFLQGHVHHNTPSLGIVMFLAQERSLETLLQNAEIAMYQAKEAGRTTFRFFDTAMQSAVTLRSQRVTDLQHALERQEFVLHYQLQVDRQGQPIGAEALVRWSHPERGMVSPAEFISLAEETRMILPLGQWVLEQACAQLALWAKDPVQALWTLSVNVSAVQFAQTDFVPTVLHALELTDANPQRLKLELTESMLIDDVQSVITKMTALRSHGVKFSLDDFGTGYSSLSYLKRLPLDQLKIDQSFVRDLSRSANDAAIANAIVALGHSLGLQVIAEGVETAQQHATLAALHCDAFQGYFFARPVAATEMPGS